jgi:hypothetical protein
MVGRAVELIDMAGTFWVIRNVALVLAPAGPLLASAHAVDWSLAWSTAMVLALLAKLADMLMHRFEHPAVVVAESRLVRFEDAAAAKTRDPRDRAA